MASRNPVLSAKPDEISSNIFILVGKGVVVGYLLCRRLMSEKINNPGDKWSCGVKLNFHHLCIIEVDILKKLVI